MRATATRTCSVDGCDRPHYGRSLCEMHLKRRQRGNDNPTESRGGKPWTDVQVRNLRRIYEAHPPPYPLPKAGELEALLGHSMRSISAKAAQLGLAGKRTSTVRSLLDRSCVACDAVFRPSAESQEACSTSCGARLSIQRHGHQRGFAGKQHTEAAKTRIGEMSKSTWARMSPEEREAKLAVLHDAPAPRRGENTYSRTRSGKRADLGGLFVRSAWEANYARFLNWLMAVGEVAAWAYEPRTFEFPVKRGNRTYTPDFMVTRPDGHIEWHEVKGWMDAASLTKLRRFAKHYPDEVLVLIDEAAYRAIARDVAGLIEGWE